MSYLWECITSGRCCLSLHLPYLCMQAVVDRCHEGSLEAAKSISSKSTKQRKTHVKNESPLDSGWIRKRKSVRMGIFSWVLGSLGMCMREGMLIAHVGKGRITVVLEGSPALHHCGNVENHHKLMNCFLNITYSLCSLDIHLPCDSRVALQHP